MEEISLTAHNVQPSLFDVSEPSHGSVELFPAVWKALEDFTSPDIPTRMAALERLVSMGAARLSPLVAYILATRLADPHLELRIQIIKLLGETLSPDSHGRLAPESVTGHVIAHLSQMRKRPIFDLLEAADFAPEIRQHIARMLNYCPYGGNHMAEILFERNAPLRVRIQAAYFIGLVGYLEVIPALERLEERLVSRFYGQQSMSFAPPPPGSGEVELLPVVRQSLQMLANTS